MSEYFVYKHTSPHGKVYIGVTSEINPNKRWGGGSGYKYNKHFYSSIKKFGWDNFKHEILFSGISKDEAIKKEVELISCYKSHLKEYGYNRDLGGYLPSNETLRKKSEKMKEVWRNPETKAKWSMAIKLSANTDDRKRRISIDVKKQWENPDRRKERSAKAAEMWKDEETRKRLIESIKRSSNTDQFKSSHSKIMKQKWADKKTKEEMIAKITEAKNTPENKAYTSKQSKERWKDKDYYFKQFGHPMAVRCVDTGEVYDSAQAASDNKGVRRQEITNCCSGFRGRKTAGGYRWEWHADELEGGGV